MSKDVNYPVFECKAARNCSTAVWRTPVEQNGHSFERISVKLQTSYKDKTGTWVNKEIYLTVDDIPPIVLVLQKAYEYCTMHIEVGDA